MVEGVVRHRRGRGIKMLLLAALIVLVAAAAFAGTASPAKKPSTLTFLVSSFTQDFNPDGATSVPSGQVVTNVYPSWFYFPTKLKNGIYVPDFRAPVEKWQPRLVVSWKQNNPTTWTFTLRKGLKSCAGNELTTADVLYTFNRGLAVNKNMRGLYVFQGILDANDKSTSVSDQVAAVNKYTFRIKTATVSRVFPYVLADKTHAIIYDSKLMKEHSSDADPWARNWLSGGNSGRFRTVLRRRCG